MHWRSWEWLSTPKNLGGMCFWDLVLFNQAMLGVNVGDCSRILPLFVLGCLKVVIFLIVSSGRPHSRDLLCLPSAASVLACT
jgi:hypothetical protein